MVDRLQASRTRIRCATRTIGSVAAHEFFHGLRATHEEATHIFKQRCSHSGTVLLLWRGCGLVLASFAAGSSGHLLRLACVIEKKKERK